MHSKTEIEVLVSTMNRVDVSFLDKMNVLGNCVVINQSFFEDKKLINNNERIIKFFSYVERGLSLSRNRAIENSKGDICLIADDDLVYEEKYQEILETAYKKYYDADIIVFDVLSTNIGRPESRISTRNCRIGFIKSMKVSSYRISFRRNSIVNNNITFDHLFGAGSVYNSGEENIFLFDCLKKKLKIYFVPNVIATVSHDSSTWFYGFNKQYFISKGALGHRLFKSLDFLYIIQFLIRKYKLYKNELSFINASKFMFEGRKQYLRQLNSGKR